jgi:hypothetical protein
MARKTWRFSALQCGRNNHYAPTQEIGDRQAF